MLSFDLNMLKKILKKESFFNVSVLCDKFSYRITQTITKFKTSANTADVHITINSEKDFPKAKYKTNANKNINKK